MNCNITNIVAAFPLCGKSYAAKNHPELYIDLESSEYHFTGTGDKRTVNPLFPGNYVAEACRIAAENRHKIVFVSSHAAVIKEFVARDVKPVLVCPPFNSKGKDEWVRRYVERTHNGFPLEVLQDNYMLWVDDMHGHARNHGLPIITIGTSQYITGVVAPDAQHIIKSAGTSESFIQLEPLTNDEELLLLETLGGSFTDAVGEFAANSPRLHANSTKQFKDKLDTYLSLYAKVEKAVKDAAATRLVRNASKR